MLQLTRKAKEAMDRGEGVTAVPTDDTTHSEGQWSYGWWSCRVLQLMRPLKLQVGVSVIQLFPLLTQPTGKASEAWSCVRGSRRYLVSLLSGGLMDLHSAILTRWGWGGGSGTELKGEPS